MRVLTDTHILMWALLQPERLDAVRRDVLESPEHQVFFSASISGRSRSSAPSTVWISTSSLM